MKPGRGKRKIERVEGVGITVFQMFLRHSEKILYVIPTEVEGSLDYARDDAAITSPQSNGFIS